MSEQHFTIEQFYKFLQQQKLMAGKCVKCGKIHLPPRPMCDNCFGLEFEWVQISGEFTLNANGTLTTLDVYLEGPAPDINFFVDDVVVSGPEANKVGQADPNAAKTEPNVPGKNAK